MPTSALKDKQQPSRLIGESGLIIRVFVRACSDIKTRNKNIMVLQPDGLDKIQLNRESMHMPLQVNYKQIVIFIELPKRNKKCYPIHLINY